MKRKYIIGIGVLIVLICLSLVMCSLFDGTYEGEKIPIETTEDIFDDGEEDNTSQNNTSESGNGESDVNETGNSESETNGSILGQNNVEENGTNESSKDVSDTKNEQENGNNPIDEGWGPFY